MDRVREPVEFGFPTAPYIPFEHPRPLWKTLLFGALLSLIPVVGPAISAVYVDRRRIPGTYSASAAFRTALVQFLAVAMLAAIVLFVVVVVLGVSIQFNPRLVRSSG